MDNAAHHGIRPDDDNRCLALFYKVAGRCTFLTGENENEMLPCVDQVKETMHLQTSDGGGQIGGVRGPGLSPAWTGWT